MASRNRRAEAQLAQLLEDVIFSDSTAPEIRATFRPRIAKAAKIIVLLQQKVDPT